MGRATLKFELVLSSEAQSRIGTDGTGNGGDGVQEATSQKFLLVTMEEPKSLHSLLVTHMSLKVESEHRMEPPTQAPYVAQGLVDTWMGWRRQSGGERGGEWEEASIELLLYGGDAECQPRHELQAHSFLSPENTISSHL